MMFDIRHLTSAKAVQTCDMIRAYLRRANPEHVVLHRNIYYALLRAAHKASEGSLGGIEYAGRPLVTKKTFYFLQSKKKEPDINLFGIAKREDINLVDHLALPPNRKTWLDRLKERVIYQYWFLYDLHEFGIRRWGYV